MRHSISSRVVRANLNALMLSCIACYERRDSRYSLFTAAYQVRGALWKSSLTVESDVRFADVIKRHAQSGRSNMYSRDPLKRIPSPLTTGRSTLLARRYIEPDIVFPGNPSVSLKFEQVGD